MTKLQLLLVMETAGLFGMLMHFLKLNIKWQKPEAIVEYITDNFKDTLVDV